MCLKDKEQASEGMENLISLSKHHDNHKTWPLHSQFLHSHNDNLEKIPTCDHISLGNSIPLESICEETIVPDIKQNVLNNFVHTLRSGEWYDIGHRSNMEDAHIYIQDLAKNFGYNYSVRKLFPSMVSLLVTNVGDYQAVLSRRGVAIEMSKDHKPCCDNERVRIELLGGFIDDSYLNGQLGVTRALGDWHIKGLKEIDERGGGPLSVEPELKLITLTKEDEFLIIGSDGIWDVFRSQNAVDFARRRLQEHNDVKKCCKEVVEEAIKRGQ